MSQHEYARSSVSENLEFSVDYRPENIFTKNAQNELSKPLAQYLSVLLHFMSTVFFTFKA